MPETVGTLAADLKFKTDFANLQKDIAKVNTILSTTGKQMASIAGKAQTSAKGLSKSWRDVGKNVWAVYGNFKDIGRVATGILMARAINSILRSLLGAINALKEFNSLLETTQISFKYLMQISTDQVDSFVRKLENLAAVTPYTFETVTTGAQRLLALGFGQEQIMPMLRLMADLNAATGGGAEQLEALAYAFGKVQAMGKMTTRELRLFVTANIPIYKILREELGLTDKDFQKLRISASQAIPAILKGIEKFRGAAAEAEKTIPGLLSSIHDYLLFLGQEILGTLWESMRGFLTNFRDLLSRVREAFRTGGIKAALSELFPPELASVVINIYNSLVKLGQSLSHVWKVTAPLRQELARLGISVANTVIKAISGLTKIIEFLATNSAKSAKFLKILAEAILGLMVAVTVSKVVLALVNSISMLFSGANIAIPILVTLGTVLAALALSIPSVQRWMSSLGQTIAGTLNIADRSQGLMGYINGVRKSVADTSELSFQDLVNGFSDVGEEASETGKKIKDTFLASFDEVYAIPDKMEEAGAGGLGELGGFGDIDLGAENLRQYADLAGKVSDISNELAKQRASHEDIFKNINREGHLLAGTVASLKKEWTGSFWTHPWASIKRMFNDIAGYFVAFWSNPIKSLEEGIPALRESLEKKMTDTVLKWSDGLSNFVLKVSEGISYIVTTISGIIEDIVLQISGYIQQFIIWSINAWNTVKQWAIESWTNIKNNAIGVWNEIKQWAIESWNNIKNNALVIWNFIKTWAILVWEIIKNHVLNIWETIKTKATGVWDYITIWAKTNWDVIVEKAKNIWSTIETWAKGIWTSITSWAGSQWDTIYEKAKSIWDGIKSWASKIFTEIVNSFIDAWNKLPFNDISKITVPTVTTPTKSINLSKLDYSNYGKPKGAASGGVVYKDQLINVGEGGQSEVIAPLSKNALAPFANMIAGLINQSGSNTGNQIASDYVLIPVNKRQLERELYVIRKQEALRRGA